MENTNYFYDLTEYTLDKELTFIIKEYLLSLLGIVWIKDSFEEYIVSGEEKIISNIFVKENAIVFLSSKKAKKGFKIVLSSDFKDSYLKRIRPVYDEILKITYNNFENSNEQVNKYDSFSEILKNYEYAVEKGISNWLADKNSECLMRLLFCLDKWSSKTYEGKKVPFAFIVDFKSDNGSFNYIEFLEEEFSATLSDGITSAIELDQNLNFLNYLSITKDNTFKQIDLSTSPYRFSQVIMSFTKRKIGVFLLSSGDVVIVKDTKIELIKRNGKWINFNKDIFVSVVMAVNTKDNALVSSELLNAIFYTSLDVSFSHCGGLIAVISDKSMLTNQDEYFTAINVSLLDKEKNNKENDIIKYTDDLQFELINYSQLCKINSQVFDNHNAKKVFNKRKAIFSLLKDYVSVDKKISFIKIDRKLRSELVSMDGATILDKNGNVISFGAIIKNNSGSSGGGRGAAAKKLSEYGLAIKISTDGYIEVYIKNELKYKMK